MPKIGDYSFPRYGFDTAIENAGTLVNDFNGKIGSDESFAQALGHSTSNSGSYNKKKGDLKKFGLLDKNSQATPLAQRIVHPKGQEDKREAKYKALQNIDLLKDIYEYSDGERPDEDFWIKISEVANTSPKEAKEVADDVKELYNKMLDYKPKEEQNQSNEDETEEQKQAKKGYAVPEDVKLRLLDNEGNKLDVKSERDLQVAKAFFESRIEEIESED